MIRLLYIFTIFVHTLTAEDSMKPPSGNIGSKNLGFLSVLTDAQWNEFAEEKILDQYGVQLYKSSISKESFLMIYNNTKYFVIHKYLSHLNRYAVEIGSNNTNLILKGYKDAKSVTFLIDTKNAKFTYVSNLILTE